MACFCILTLLAAFLSELVPEDKFDVELIVQCIRSSESPQTHNQALLLLATAAKLFPVSQVISNCDTVVTFCGKVLNFMILFMTILITSTIFAYTK